MAQGNCAAGELKRYVAAGVLACSHPQRRLDDSCALPYHCGMISTKFSAVGSPRLASIVLLFCLGCAFAALAAEKDKAKKDPNSPVGTWRWSFTTQSGDTIDSSIKLKKEGDRLTGTFIGRNGSEAPIENAQFKDGQLSFSVTRERDGQKFTTQYRGKMAGDTVTGQSEWEWGGEKRTRDWLAKWEPPKAKGEGISGTWKWSGSFGGRSIETTAKLKQEGEKVTGVIIGRRGETKIEHGTLKDGKLTFSYTRDFQGNSFTSKFSGKPDGDKIVGTIEFPGRDGDPQTRDWEAVRAGDEDEKEKKKTVADGTWKWTYTSSSGQNSEPSVKLKQDDDKLTGSLVWNENEVPIEEGKVTDSEISFKVVRERDGEKYTTKFAGKIDGDTLKGKVDSNWGGQDRTTDWEAKRVSK